MARNSIDWFEIYVQDMNRARAFYESVFATHLERLEGPDIEMWAFPGKPDQPGARGALIRMPGLPSGGNSTIVYFTCADCATEAKRASAGGGKIFKEKFSIGEHGFIALVTDTEGNMIGLHSKQ
jgi:uncharacterized protein